MEKLPASEIPVGATVKVRDDTPVGPGSMVIVISQIGENMPARGLRTWFDSRGLTVIIGNTTRVEVVRMPEEKKP